MPVPCSLRAVAPRPRGAELGSSLGPSSSAQVTSPTATRLRSGRISRTRLLRATVPSLRARTRPGLTSLGCGQPRRTRGSLRPRVPEQLGSCSRSALSSERAAARTLARALRTCSQRITMGRASRLRTRTLVLTPRRP